MVVPMGLLVYGGKYCVGLDGGILAAVDKGRRREKVEGGRIKRCVRLKEALPASATTHPLRRAE